MGRFRIVPSADGRIISPLPSLSTSKPSLLLRPWIFRKLPRPMRGFRTTRSAHLLHRVLSRAAAGLLTLCVLLAALFGGRATQEEIEKDEVAASASCPHARHSQSRAPRSLRGESRSISRHLNFGVSRLAIRKLTGQPVLAEGHVLPNGMRAPLLS
jgi:hypothetical protein